MLRRVERIAAQALGDKRGAVTDALWYLPRHRRSSASGGAFTIHYREDSADLMNLVRHDVGFSKTEKRFPMKRTCLAIYLRTINGEAPLHRRRNRTLVRYAMSGGLNLVFLRYHAYSLQRSAIVIFSLFRPLGQFDLIVVMLLVRNETQDM